MEKSSLLLFCFIFNCFLTPLINNPESLRDLTIFIISFLSSLEITCIVKPDSNIFLWIAASVADAAAVNPKGIKTLLATFPIKGNPVFNNGPKRQPINPPDGPILCYWVFDNFILAEELFAKALRSLNTFA